MAEVEEFLVISFVDVRGEHWTYAVTRPNTHRPPSSSQYIAAPIWHLSMLLNPNILPLLILSMLALPSAPLSLSLSQAHPPLLHSCASLKPWHDSQSLHYHHLISSPLALTNPQ